MERRMIALVCAVLAACLVAMAGRSCAKDIHEKNMQSKKNSSAPTEDDDFDYIRPNYSNVGEVETKPQKQYDKFGRPIQDDALTEEPAVEPATDEEGNYIEPVDPVIVPEIQEVTDAFGNVTETIAVIPDEQEPVDAPDGEGEEGQQEDGDRLPFISGFNHNTVDRDGNYIPTLPPDFSIVIE